MTSSSWFVLGGHDNRTVSLCFALGGSGGIPVSSSFILGGSGGRSMSSSFILGGSGGRSMSSSFVLGGIGGRSMSSSFNLGGSGGGVSLPSSCSSILSDSLGSKRISSCENCCGGIGGGLPRGLWELDVASSLAGREPGGVIDVSEPQGYGIQSITNKNGVSNSGTERGKRC